MEENLSRDIIDNTFDISSYSPALLSYFGDAVYEIFVRKYVLGNGDVKSSILNDRARMFVSAYAQSKAVEIIIPLLSDEEMAVYKSGRNSNSSKVPKSASPVDYRRASGLEALFGMLWLCGRFERAKELFCEIANQNDAKDSSSK